MPGTVLLLAASPTGKGRLVDAASVLPVLAAVPPAILSGTETANVVELADPLEPQAVLTRLRAAAAAPGPLTVFVTGQLHLDRKQRLPHLALARTTPATLRYTGLPWHWVREELRLRPAGATTLVLDLHADPETWELLRTAPLDSGRNNAVHGRIAPPPARRGIGSPSYMKAVATVLRSGHRPAMAELHRQVLARLGADVAADLLLSTHTPDSGDPHDAISAAVRQGRYAEADGLAARWEEAAARAHGPASEDALHWSEVRADLAMFAGDAARSCRTWLTVARTRLAAGEPADTPAVEAAVDRAHHQWSAIKDTARARELGPALAELRLRVPGRREGALENVQQHLRQLQTS
ncbi:hypothetical protein AB0M11_04475 [Streptomyces sp. NPDC051987]|uniref:hypothetical protein n=1 Tax=Streptomyces sp. NPDC051987 TaxID=3155808 RepID=UPI0034436FB6